jgi:hypothetical protein
MAEITRRTLFNRTLLASALGAGALLGLTRPIRHKVAAAPPAPPAALTAALHRQQRLLAGYDLVLAHPPARPDALTALRSDIAAHGSALRAVLERYPGWRLAQASASSPAPSGSAAPSSSPAPPDTVSALASATRAAAAAAATACLDWPAGEADAGQVVPLLGSIAACLTTHLQVLA